MVIYIPESSVRIVNSNNYVSGDEMELAENFNLNFVPHFFPTLPRTYSLQDYYSKLPFDFYLSVNDTNHRIYQKRMFYNSYCSKSWDLAKELMITANLKLQLLTNSMLFFLKESFEFQVEIKKTFQWDNIDRPNIVTIQESFVNPFNHPICSIGSLMYNIYCIHYSNYFDLHCVRKEYGTFNKTVSRSEHKFTSFMHYKYPDRNLISAFSCDEGQKYYRESIPDLFCEDTKEAWYFLGCQVHGHIAKNHNSTEESKNFFGHSFKELNSTFNSKIDSLMRNNEEIKRVNLIWECEFKNMIKSDVELKQFLDHHYIEHPLQRLIPRNVMRGAFVDSYALKWSNLTFADENFFAIDLNGLYSSIAIENDFMTGKYEVVMGKKLNFIKIFDNQFYYHEKRVMGSALITILAPMGMKYPFLPYRKVDGTSVNICCKMCAEITSAVCKHTDTQRSFTAVYMLSEIEYALSLGYTLLAVFELHVYEKFSKILKPFIVHLNYLKTKYSDLFNTNMSKAEKQAYCDLLNNEMRLNNDFILAPKTVRYNKAKRNFYKFAANSFFGKFAQRQDQQVITFVTNQSELEKLMQKEGLHDLFCVSENLCMVSTEKNKLKIPPNLKYNVYIGSQITAFARQRIHEDRKSTRLNSSHIQKYRMPSSA